MTSVAIELSVDSRGPCAIYLATDSRISWSPTSNWDGAQKCFASRRTPDLFSYCGDAFFPPYLLRQAMEHLEAGAIDGGTSSDRHQYVTNCLKSSLAHSSRAPLAGFTIFHASRDSYGMDARFRLWRTRYWSKANSWDDTEIDLTEQYSLLAYIDGTGSNAISNALVAFTDTELLGKSRTAMWAFFDAVRSGKDAHSGGAPQLVSLQRVHNGLVHGLIWDGKRFFAGAEVGSGGAGLAKIWFNSDFERCDFLTGERLKGDRPHRRPSTSSGV